jgi:hypothetical protein
MTTTVRDQSAAVASMAENWPIIDALLGGTPAMRKAGSTYLPQWPGESDDAYKARKDTATLFPAFPRTVEVLAGKPFSKPVTLTDDVPTRIKDWCDTDIDLQGRNLHAFAASLSEEALSHGITGILVDYPKATGARTKAEENAAGIRPYWVHIHAGNILGWRSKRINGAEVFTQLRLLEQVIEDDGEFGEKMVEQVRVLTPGAWATYRKSEKVDPTTNKPEWISHEDGVTTLDVIPFVPIYGRRTGFMTAVPPLLELAHMNVEHWQSKSDQQTILHVARVPILFGKGLDGQPVIVGAGSMVTVDSDKADLKYVEHTGAAIEAGRLSLLDLEDRMRQVGAELLVIKPGKTTVAQTVAENEAGMCALQRLIEDVEDGIDQALSLTALWIKEAKGGNVQIFKDFGVATLAEASIDLLRDMNVDGTFSDESLFNEAKRRGYISPETTWDDEKKRIAQNVPKGELGAVGITD